MSKCDCSGPGFCKKYNANVSNRQWQFCQGTSGLPREKELFYLSRIHREPTNFNEPQKVLSNQAKKFPKDNIKIILNFILGLLLYIKSKRQKVTESEFNRRNSICDKCPHLIKEDGLRKCGVCHCILDIKAWWEVMDCPLGFWEKTFTIKKGCGCG